jgi:hypothetical protein
MAVYTIQGANLTFRILVPSFVSCSTTCHINLMQHHGQHTLIGKEVLGLETTALCGAERLCQCFIGLEDLADPPRRMVSLLMFILARHIVINVLCL